MQLEMSMMVNLKVRFNWDVYKMKVGILNVQWLNNMGSVLLAFAVQKKLDQMGIENEVINFMTQKLEENGEIPSVHKEEKASSFKKI